MNMKIKISTLWLMMFFLVCLTRPSYQKLHCEEWGLGRHSVTVTVDEPSGGSQDYVISTELLKVLKDKSLDKANWIYVTCGVSGLFCAQAAIRNQQLSTQYGDARSYTSGSYQEAGVAISAIVATFTHIAVDRRDKYYNCLEMYITEILADPNPLPVLADAKKLGPDSLCDLKASSVFATYKTDFLHTIEEIAKYSATIKSKLPQLPNLDRLRLPLRRSPRNNAEQDASDNVRYLRKSKKKSKESKSVVKSCDPRKAWKLLTDSKTDTSKKNKTRKNKKKGESKQTSKDKKSKKSKSSKKGKNAGK